MPLDEVSRQVQSITAGAGTEDSGSGGKPGKYDPAKYIIPGQDAQGHSERIFCRVPPSVLRQVEIVVRGKKFPFRTNGDIFRWAIWTGLTLLERMEPTPNTFMVRTDAVNAILRDEIYQQEYMATFESMEKVISRHIANGATGEARRLVARVKSQFQMIEEGYWRERCLGELKSRWGYLLEVKKNVGLTGEIEGEASKVEANHILETRAETAEAALTQAQQELKKLRGMK